jgi:hypothetical protein
MKANSWNRFLMSDHYKELAADRRGWTGGHTNRYGRSRAASHVGAALMTGGNGPIGSVDDDQLIASVVAAGGSPGGSLIVAATTPIAAQPTLSGNNNTNNNNNGTFTTMRERNATGMTTVRPALASRQSAIK